MSLRLLNAEFCMQKTRIWAVVENYDLYVTQFVSDS